MRTVLILNPPSGISTVTEKRMSVEDTENDQIFLEVAGIGLEAALFPAAEEIKNPGLLTTLHGIISGLKTLLTFKPTRIRITFDDRQRRPYEAIQITICNAPFYGMHLEVVPNILMDDGLLDVVIYRNFNKLEYICVKHLS